MHIDHFSLLTLKTQTTEKAHLSSVYPIFQYVKKWEKMGKSHKHRPKIANIDLNGNIKHLATHYVIKHPIV